VSAANASDAPGRAAGSPLKKGTVPPGNVDSSRESQLEERDSPLFQRPPSRFVVGIDLGTTNCAVGYVDTHETAWKVRTLRVPQLVAAGQVEPRDVLPSFHYQPAAGEFSVESLRLPWQTGTGHSAVEKGDSPSRQNQTAAGESLFGNGQSPFSTAAGQPASPIVGSFARDHGALSQGRLIESAKSWLSHAGVDRTAELLPWHGLPEVEKISPVEASARYLKHIHDAWNDQFPESPLDRQDVIVTLPASFDEVARELTVKAAALAGLSRIVLIEEPQAAFYAWINRHRDDWELLVKPGQKILICDIGGGTSDFTLIRVRARDDGKIQFQRVAVGEHLILGGDNLDLALAHAVETMLVGDRKLEPRQWGVLVRLCRQVKETLLGENPPEKVTLHLPSSGSRLIGGGLQAIVTRAQVESLLVQGFLPNASLDDRPNRHRSGFQEFGLPYAPDPAITRYLADFLLTHRHVGEEAPVVAEPAGNARRETKATASRARQLPAPAKSATEHDPARPDIVLFNGGFFASPVLRERLLNVLNGWFPSKSKKAWSPIVLDHDRLDLAVAHGAAYYGMVRRSAGVKIAAGLARTYYIGVEGDEPQAVCLIAAGTEPGQDVDLADPTFELLVSQPVEFPLYVSSTRLSDVPGAIVPFDREKLMPLPPIRTVIRSASKGETGHVPIQLHARLSEIGTLDLWCSSLDQDRRWKLQFDVRSATQSDIAPHEGAGERAGLVDESVWEQCHELIRRTFGPHGAGPQGTDAAEGLIKRLAAAIGSDRSDWPASLLRRLWDGLMEMEAGRTRTAMHEARWLNLAGFSLRPGYGLPADDWRVSETRRILLGKPGHATPACLSERWILWRRIGGGLPAGQQRALADTVLPQLREMAAGSASKRASKSLLGSHKTAEMWRLVGALELLPLKTKIDVGELIVRALVAGRLAPLHSALCWTLGRLGARQPSYGPLNMVVPPDIVSGWLPELAMVDDSSSVFQLALMQLARRTGDRYRDISEAARDTVLKAMQTQHAPTHFITLVQAGGLLDTEEQNLVFGEALPKGLRIR